MKLTKIETKSTCKKLLGTFALMSFLVACGQNFNSNTFDVNKFTGIGSDGTPAGERYFQAYLVIKDQCMSCHTGYHNGYSAYTESIDWVNAGLVVPGNLSASPLYNYLKVYGDGAQSMPKDNPALISLEAAALEDWILNL